jgi:endonuclease G
LIASQDIPRTNQFFEEARLPEVERAKLDDYRDSDYDRGHMAAAGNMGTEESKAQSFSLANIVPQNAENNRNAWRKIEADTRKYAMRAEGDVFVITGPVFDGTPPTIGDSEVWVPQHLFKLVYDPTTGRVWAHWQDNTAEARVGKPISYEDLVQRTGVEFLPGWKGND